MLAKSASVRVSSAVQPLFVEGCSTQPLTVFVEPWFIVSNELVSYTAVPGLLGPCISSDYLQRKGLPADGPWCAQSVTFPSFTGCNTEVLAFAVVDDCPVDLLVSVEWLVARSLESGKFTV